MGVTRSTLTVPEGHVLRNRERKRDTPMLKAQEAEMAYRADWLDAQQRVQMLWLGRLESLLARHWPEATRVLDLGPDIPRWVAPQQSPTPFHQATGSLPCEGQNRLHTSQTRPPAPDRDQTRTTGRTAPSQPGRSRR